MIAVRLPPYGNALTLTSTLDVPTPESFIAEFRALDRAAFSDRLNDGACTVRARASQGLLSIVALLDHASRLTPLFQAVRLMRIERQLEDMVNAAISPSQAQNKVDAFLKRRMLYLYPDLSQYEQQAVHQRAAELLASPPKTEKPQSEAGEVATCRTKSCPIRTTQQNSSSCAATTELISSSRRYSAVPNAM
jgi:hypothetical protein